MNPIPSVTRTLSAMLGDRDAQRVRSGSKECFDDISADDLATTGETGDFVNFLAFPEVSVFTFFKDPFELFVIRAPETEVIRVVNSARLAMSDVDGFRAVLRNYGKEKSDLTVPLSDAINWMNGRDNFA